MKKVRVFWFLIVTTLILYLNVYSQEIEFESHTITTGANQASSVYAIDVDSDGDMDVLSASWDDDKIAWYENLQMTGLDENNNLIQKLNYLTNFPNPFNPETNIVFNLLEEGQVQLDIYNIKGQKVKQLIKEQLIAGSHTVDWNGKNNSNKSVASGIYFYKISTGKDTDLKKMLLLK